MAELEESGHLRSQELPCDYCGAVWVETEDTDVSGRTSFRGIVMNHEEDCAYLSIDDEDAFYVTAYAITRHYGGPEEGGWWYNWHQVIDEAGPFETDEEAEASREALKTKHADVAHGDIYSMAGGVALAVYVEDTPRDSESTERPHYE